MANDQIREIVLQSLARESAARGWTSADPPHECIPFRRAHQLTLNPDRFTNAEREHAVSCLQAVQKIAAFKRQSVHLSLWTILWTLRGSANEDDRRAVAFHLDEGECPECGKRREWLQRGLTSVARLRLGTFAEPRLGLAGAARTLGQPVWSEDRRLRVRISQTDERDLLQVSSESEDLENALVAFGIGQPDGEPTLTGYLVLSPESKGMYTGSIKWPAGHLARSLAGMTAEATVVIAERPER